MRMMVLGVMNCANEPLVSDESRRFLTIDTTTHQHRKASRNTHNGVFVPPSGSNGKWMSVNHPRAMHDGIHTNAFQRIGRRRGRCIISGGIMRTARTIRVAKYGWKPDTP